MEKLLLVKIGGNVIDAPAELAAFLDDFSALPGRKLLVHGGGKLATDLAATLGITTQMIDGRRITDAETLKVVTMVYGGLINKTLVSGLQARGCNALGLTGADADSVRAGKRRHPHIDFGYVGDIERVDTAALQTLLGAGLVPVFAPLTHDGRGQMLNTNADTLAAALASALSGRYDITLIYCFDKKGVLASSREDDVVPLLTPADYQQLKAGGVISKGMLPKLDEAFAALQHGVASVVLCHASQLRQAAAPASNAGTRLRL
ncbi:MAG: acetylglutamate kinase [candidate division KSB1 bacterium]|nr:acetylglutamate kinase [candidate division KSB1 bacterium]MDZ7273669.1 acetylglutamate kinase [candidate division KSB1 bacterium]MDZ7285825.1 acetylglutamate kinase [candidate division KSB1 bacterium]MDZ7298857.1 acetylglutamate kinase [candidate division KSB1 bacterium]MDZ7307097.1 acetylglutamate kinase [candidate division KSB1 bacterium]